MQIEVERFLTYSDLKNYGVPHSRMHLWRLERDGKFPRRIAISCNRAVWLASEIRNLIPKPSSCNPPETISTERTVRFPELQQIFGIPYSRSHIPRLEKLAQLPFPKNIPTSTYRVGWRAVEVAEWMKRVSIERRAKPFQLPPNTQELTRDLQ